MKKQSVAVIVFSPDRQKILLIKRRDIPVWTLPGGGIDPGETPEEAAIRELEEETLCKNTIVRKIADYQKVNLLTYRTHFFECAIVGNPQKSVETQDVQFFSLDEFPHAVPPPFTYWIQDALLEKTELIVKPVEGVGLGKFLELLAQHPIIVLRFLLSRIGIHLNSVHCDRKRMSSCESKNKG